jgi:hypothetical protein
MRGELGGGTRRLAVLIIRVKATTALTSLLVEANFKSKATTLRPSTLHPLHTDSSQESSPVYTKIYAVAPAIM